MAEIHVITGLVSKCSELADIIAHHNQEITRLSEELKTVDAAIKLFDPEYKIQGIKYPHNNNLRFELKVSKLDSDMLADGGEDPVDGIEQVIGGLVVQRPKPAFFHFLPKAFNDVVVRRIRRQVVDEQVALLP